MIIPFRELEMYDSFLLPFGDGRECEKIGLYKYLTYEALPDGFVPCVGGVFYGEPRSLETADPNMMVEYESYEEAVAAEALDNEENAASIERKEHEEAVENENQFFHSLLNLLDGLEKYEGITTIESLKQFAKDFLRMPEDS